MARRAWYPRYPADYAADTQGLSLEAHGLYTIMLDDYWLHGPFPADLRRTSRRLRRDLRQISRILVGELAPFWKEVNGELRNPRMDRELAKAFDKSAKARAAINKRWAYERMDTNEYTDGIPPQPHQEELQIPTTQETRSQADDLEFSPPLRSPPKRGNGEHRPSTQGHRLPFESFEALPEEWGQWVIAEFGRPAEAWLEREAELFVDYWRAQPGARGRKTDWAATWRVWMRKAEAEQSRRQARR